VALGLTLAPPYSVEAKTFYCRAGDVQCFIASITEANASAKQKNTINLEAGVYTLVDVNNTTDGPNGLPSITGSLAIRGVGNDLTRIERNINTPCFRILHVAATGVLTLDGLAVSQGANASERGAGLFNNGGAVTMTQTTFTGNRSDPFSCGAYAFPRGGGLYTTGGVVTIAKSSFVHNYSYTSGGGLYIDDNAAIVTITDTTIVGNGGFLGSGGLHSEGTVTIINSTVAQNTVGQGEGGGIGSFGSAYILNSTIVENSAGGYGGGTGGINGYAALQNTIVADNTYNGAPSNCFPTSLGNNLIGDLSGCHMTLLPSDLTGDPGLAPFRDEGAPGTGHYPLLSTSQAINAGSPAVCPKTDQLGEKRDKLCDIGSIEFQGTAVSSR